MTPAEQLVGVARSLHARRLTPGRTGNLSVRDGDRILLTPTGASLADIDAGSLSVLDAKGRHVDGPRPTKEWPLHLAVYDTAHERAAVVHLHSTYAVAVSCLDGLDPADVLPPLTAYFVLRVGAPVPAPRGQWAPVPRLVAGEVERVTPSSGGVPDGGATGVPRP